MPPTKQEPSSRQSSGRHVYLLPGLSGRGYENTLMEWKSLSWLWNQCCFPAVFCYCFFFFQDSSLIKIKILSWNLGPWELFISLHSYKGILLFPAFLLKESECKSLSRVQLFETLRTVVCRLPCPWNFPGQNTGVDNRCLLQGIFLTQELKSPALQADSLPAVILNCLLSTEGCTKTASSP